jgi:poly(ADP-ribose) glycohydrolase ARH3
MAEITLRERFRGGVLGLALGDALGAPFEGGIIERCTWRCICAATGTKLRWTDDTQMSLVSAIG